MKRQKVKMRMVSSANIYAIGFDSVFSTLYVMFKADKKTVYEYGTTRSKKIDLVFFENFLQAPSKGSFFYRELKSKNHPFRKIPVNLVECWSCGKLTPAKAPLDQPACAKCEDIPF